MGTEKRLVALQAQTLHADVDDALSELSERIDTVHANVVLLFCSAQYDLQKLGRKIASSFSAPVVACTSEGQLGDRGFQTGGITAVSLSSPELRVSSYLISPLAECQARASEAAFNALSSLLESGAERSFGLVLVDGALRTEERLAASLYQSLGTIPLIGGSGQDPHGLPGCFVYHQGRFLRDAALITLFDTTLPFVTFKVSHANPGKHRLVVTAADPEQRLVHEFNGEPAADAYAEALGVNLDELAPPLFSKHALLLRSGSDHFIRSIRQCNSDHSLSFFCALEEGLVLTVGEPADPLIALQNGFDRVGAKIGEPRAIIGCEGIISRARPAASGNRDGGEIGQLLGANRVVGFSGDGMQYNAIYVNQTLSAVALSG